MSKPEPIVAVATAPGRSGIGVVRLSGPDLSGFMTGLVGRHLSARRAELADFRGSLGEVIDRGLALYFPAPHSYTGENVLELQGHGGTVVLQLLVKRCLELGARLAEPGEFTRRSFLNGKIDLAQAEAVADLINANTAQAARHAMRSLQGTYSTRVNELVRELVELRMMIEAAIDFPEEEIDLMGRSDAEERHTRLLQQLHAVLAASRQGRLLRVGMHVALAGQPNVGKSSLLNQLAGEDLAIVTAVPGTTRDAIRLSVDLDGVPVHIIDTAGLRASDDPVEQIGIARAWVAIEHADVVLLMVDATAGETEAERAILRRLPQQVPRIRVVNKIDLAGQEASVVREADHLTVSVSALTGAGMDLLRNTLLELAGWRGGEEGVFLARARHVEALERALAHLQHAREVSTRLELLAEELRLAQQALGTITGQYSSDELLGEIFARFCIGK